MIGIVIIFVNNNDNSNNKFNLAFLSKLKKHI